MINWSGNLADVIIIIVNHGLRPRSIQDAWSAGISYEGVEMSTLLIQVDQHNASENVRIETEVLGNCHPCLTFKDFESLYSGHENNTCPLPLEAENRFLSDSLWEHHNNQSLIRYITA